MKKYLVPFFALFIVMTSGTVSATAQQQPGGQQGLATGMLEVVSKGGKHSFLVEYAATIEQKAAGMMYRTRLDHDKGMFFIYSEPERLGYWMKNCLIYLDIIYIREDGRIANIVRNAQPGDLTSRKSRGLVLAVLELAGGRAQELGIRPGDKVLHSIFKPK